MEDGVDGLLRDKTRPSRVRGHGLEVAERVVALTLAAVLYTHHDGFRERLRPMLAEDRVDLEALDLDPLDVCAKSDLLWQKFDE